MILDRSGFPLPPDDERTTATADVVYGAIGFPIGAWKGSFGHRPARMVVNNLGGGSEAEGRLRDNLSNRGYTMPLTFARGDDPFVSLCDTLAWVTLMSIKGAVDLSAWKESPPAIAFGQLFPFGRSEDLRVQDLPFLLNRGGASCN